MGIDGVAALLMAPFRTNSHLDTISVALTSYLGVAWRDSHATEGSLYVDSNVRMVDITDGTSNTLLLGERPPSSDFQFGWWYAGPTFLDESWTIVARSPNSSKRATPARL